MLRRLWVAFVRLVTGQGEHERLGRLLDLLRANGVTAYEAKGLKLHLEAVRPEQPSAGSLPPSRMPTDQELLFGEPEEQLKRQGLI